MTLELGTTSLTEARLARGLTLEDAERGTRISRRFLIALEEHDYSVFPAPVYARGFLRTYCRFLGVDPEPQLAELPSGWTESPHAAPLPPVSRGPVNLNMAWLVLGVVIASIVGLAYFVSRDGDGLSALQPQTQGEETVLSDQPAATEGSDSEAQSPTGSAPSQAGTQAVGRPLDPGLPGLLPDFVGVSAESVKEFLESQGISYVQINTVAGGTPAGLVVQQDPEPGTATAGLDQVTLMVSSSAATVPAARTDCSVLASSTQRTAAEQAYFEDNCSSVPQALPDRTSCEEIRGTDYRSPSEREFFLANCIIQ